MGLFLRFESMSAVAVALFSRFSSPFLSCSLNETNDNFLRRPQVEPFICKDNLASFDNFRCGIDVLEGTMAPPEGSATVTSYQTSSHHALLRGVRGNSICL